MQTTQNGVPLESEKWYKDNGTGVGPHKCVELKVGIYLTRVEEALFQLYILDGKPEPVGGIEALS